MKKELATTVAMAAVVVLASSCSQPLHGTVTTKRYLPAYTTYSMQPYYGTRCHYVTVIVVVGKSRHVEEEEDECSRYQIGLRLTPMYHSECYQLTVGTETECVSETQYAAVKVGDKV